MISVNFTMWLKTASGDMSRNKNYLKGNRKDEWSIRLGNTRYRGTMIPCDNEGQEITEDDILSQCKIIKIVKVTEVSNHYE